MARAAKDIVEYYPHYCDHGKTMFIVEKLYGNDGYAFWFKLLEILGKSEGHYYDCSNSDNWEFLQAKTGFRDVRCEEILNKLALLGSIDKGLWEAGKIIWSDNFIKNVTDAYRNRKRPVPQKPFLAVASSDTAEAGSYLAVETALSSDQPAVCSAGNVQSKVEYSKVDKSIANGCADSYRENLRGNGAGGTQQAGGKDRSDFAVFWDKYPRRIGIGDAMNAWNSLMALGMPARYVILAAIRYANRERDKGSEQKYIKSPQNFLTLTVLREFLPASLPECPRCRGSGGVLHIDDEGRSTTAPCDCWSVVLQGGEPG